MKKASMIALSSLALVMLDFSPDAFAGELSNKNPTDQEVEDALKTLLRRAFQNRTSQNTSAEFCPDITDKQSVSACLSDHVSACWNPPADVVDASELRVSVRFSLTPQGMVEGRPTVINSSGNRQVDESAIRAVSRCGQQGYKLPADKYDAWQDVVVNFDPSEMF